MEPKKSRPCRPSSAIQQDKGIENKKNVNVNGMRGVGWGRGNRASRRGGAQRRQSEGVAASRNEQILNRGWDWQSGAIAVEVAD